MTPGRAATYIGGALLLAAWLSSAATSLQDPELPSDPRPAATSGSDPLGADIQAQTARLRSRLAAAPIPQEPSRNPFTFASRPAPRERSEPARETAPEPAAAPVAVEPALSFVGIAEQQTAKGLVRTAMLVDATEELFMVTEGQDVLGRYLVTTITPDVVELKDTSTGIVRRLALR